MSLHSVPLGPTQLWNGIPVMTPLRLRPTPPHPISCGRTRAPAFEHARCKFQEVKVAEIVGGRGVYHYHHVSSQSVGFFFTESNTYESVFCFRCIARTTLPNKLTRTSERNNA